MKKAMESASKILIDETADHVEDSSREKLLGLKFTLNEKVELSKSWTKQFWKTLREKTVLCKSLPYFG